MQDLFSGILVGLLGAVALVLLLSRYRAAEVRLLFLAYFGHVMAGFAQVLITGSLYGSGDIFGYARRGEELAAALAIDFQTMGWELLKLLFHQDAALPITISGIGSSTGSMSAIAAFANYFTGGGVYAGCVLMGVLSFYGKLAGYEVFRLAFPERLYPRLLIANLLVPSVVFWSSGLLKESVALIGLGPLMLGVNNMLRGRYLSGLAMIVFGATLVGLVKAYILFSFALAAGGWIYAARAWHDGQPRLRPLHLALGVGFAVGTLAVLSRMFPQYAMDALTDQAAYYQDVGQTVRGGSTYELISPEDASLQVQLAYSPLALLTSLYRPLIFEGSNPQMFINALETTTLLWMSLYVLTKIPLKTSWRVLLSSPHMVFALLFVLSFGVAVGLTTTNLGTLSRYRVPLVPLFASLLVVLMAERSAPVAVPMPMRRSVRPPRTIID